jgi:hypothetical protein
MTIFQWLTIKRLVEQRPFLILTKLGVNLLIQKGY